MIEPKFVMQAPFINELFAGTTVDIEEVRHFLVTYVEERQVLAEPVYPYWAAVRLDELDNTFRHYLADVVQPMENQAEFWLLDYRFEELEKFNSLTAKKLIESYFEEITNRIIQHKWYELMPRLQQIVERCRPLLDRMIYEEEYRDQEFKASYFAHFDHDVPDDK